MIDSENTIQRTQGENFSFRVRWGWNVMRALLLTLFGLVFFVACGGSDETESVTAASTGASSTTAAITTTAEPAITTTAEPAITTTAEPATTTTAEPATTTTTISAERLAAAAAVGDIVAGEELFSEPLDGLPESQSCSNCHTFDSQPARNPKLTGIGTAAAHRIEGMSAVEYLRESIVDPYAFVADGEWLSSAMPYRYPDLFTEDQINDVIAYLLTQ